MKTIKVMAILCAILLMAPAVKAATVTWDANAATSGQTDGAGNWLNASQWWTGTANATWSSGDDAVFGNGGAGGAVTNTSPITVNSLTFNYFTGTYTLGLAGQTITLNNGLTKNPNSGTVAFAGPLLLGAAQTWTNSAGTIQPSGAQTLNTGGFDLTIDGSGVLNCSPSGGNTLAITGGGGIIKKGAGSITLDSNPTVAHTFTGNITIHGGSIGFQTASVLSGKNVKLTDGYLGGRFGSGFTWTGGLGTNASQIQITGGTSGLSGEGGTSSGFQIGNAGSTLVWGASGEGAATGFFNPSVFLANGDVRMNTNGKGSLNNAIDLNGATRTITSLQTTDGAATSGFTISGAIVNGTGTAGLIKTGPGNLILAAANTYNGPTTLTGGSITLSGSGTINGTSALTLNGGTLRLVNTAQANRFADGATITTSATTGGTISYENTSGSAVYTETLGSMALSGGQLNIVEATAQAGSGSQTLTLGALTRTGLSAVTFSAASTGPQASGSKNMIVVTGGGTTATGDIIGPWATVGTAANAQTDYAAYSSDYVVPANIAASAETNWLSTAGNYTMNAGTGATTLTAPRNINSVRNISPVIGNASVDIGTDVVTLSGHTLTNGDVFAFGGTPPGGAVNGVPYYVRDVVPGTSFKVAASSSGAAIDLTSAGTPNITGGLTLPSGMNLGTYGILHTMASGLAIGGSGGVVTLPSASSDNLYLTPGNSAAIGIGVPITDNGAGKLTLVKSGLGTLRLYSVSTYTGDTVINAGTLQVGLNGFANGAKLGGSGGNYAGNIFIAGGALLDIQSDASQTLSGTISGEGSIVKRYTGTLTLSGTNTYIGKTTLVGITTAGAGTLSVSSLNSIYTDSTLGTVRASSSSLGAPTTVANGTIDLGSGSTQSSSDTLKYTGPGETTDRVINFVNNNNNSTRNVDASGTGHLKFTSTPTSPSNIGNIGLSGTGSGEFVGGLPFVFQNLTKSGNGTWRLGGVIGSFNNTTISGGTLIGVVGGGAPNSAVTVNNTLGCRLGIVVSDSSKQWTCKSLTSLGTNAKLAFGFTTAPSLTLAPLNVSGTLTFTGVPSITVDSANLVSGQSYPLLVCGGIAPSETPSVTIGHGLTGTTSWTGNTLYLNVSGTSTLPLTWAASESGTWDINNTPSWKDAASTSTNYLDGFISGDAVMFADTYVNADTMVTLNTTVKPSSVTSTNMTYNYTITGSGSISGTTGLTKSGIKSLSLGTTNTYTGATTINGGALVGLTGGSCNNSDVTVNSNGALGVRVAISNAQWSCKNVTVSTATGTKLTFAFTAGPSTTLAPLKVNGNLTFTGTPAVEVSPANLVMGTTYPLVEVIGAAPTTTLPTLIGIGGDLFWQGKTLYLTPQANGTLIVIY